MFSLSGCAPSPAPASAPHRYRERLCAAAACCPYGLGQWQLLSSLIGPEPIKIDLPGRVVALEDPVQFQAQRPGIHDLHGAENVLPSHLGQRSRINIKVLDSGAKYV